MKKVDIDYTMVDEYDGVWEGKVWVEVTEEEAATFEAVMAAYEEGGDESLCLEDYLEEHLDASLYDSVVDEIYDDWRERVVDDALDQYGSEVFDVDEEDCDDWCGMSEEQLRDKAYMEMEFPGASIERIGVEWGRE